MNSGSFFQENRWKKRGIGISLMRFQLDFYFYFHALVSIYAPDGTVAISHGGIEMGQGVNTKVLRICIFIFVKNLIAFKISIRFHLLLQNNFIQKSINK